MGRGDGGGSEERVGISGAMMVVNSMNNGANMVEIFGCLVGGEAPSALKYPQSHAFYSCLDHHRVVDSLRQSTSPTLLLFFA